MRCVYKGVILWFLVNIGWVRIKASKIKGLECVVMGILGIVGDF